MSNTTNEASNQRIGKLLQEARKSGNKKQMDMVSACGLTKNHLSSIERGAAKASIDVLLGYCEVLGLTPNEILGFESRSTNIFPELIAELSRIDIEKQKKILAMIQLIMD